MRHGSLATLLSFLFCISGAANAATLNVVSGQLFGASGVNVGGTLYDVEFVDGTCIALFTGCDESSDFAFTDLASAQIAGQALLDQVFIDGTYSFDTVPNLTNGCESTDCFANTPFAVTGTDVQNSSAYNLPVVSGDTFDQITGSSASDDLGEWSVDVYVVWTLVPEPSTASLLALGLVGLAAKRRRAN